MKDYCNASLTSGTSRRTSVFKMLHRPAAEIADKIVQDPNFESKIKSMLDVMTSNQVQQLSKSLFLSVSTVTVSLERSRANLGEFISPLPKASKLEFKYILL